MCLNGGYSERGIKDRHGYGSDRFRIEPEFAVKIDTTLGLLGVLLEPASILAKAWDHTERVGRRLHASQPRTLLVTGAGPIGLLAALMGSQRGLDVYVFDRPFEPTKAQLVQDLGGTYDDDTDRLDHLRPDILMECSGAPALIARVLSQTAPGGISKSHRGYLTGTRSRNRSGARLPNVGARQSHNIWHRKRKPQAL